jgi:hypothetical protein
MGYDSILRIAIDLDWKDVNSEIIKDININMPIAIKDILSRVNKKNNWWWHSLNIIGQNCQWSQDDFDINHICDFTMLFPQYTFLVYWHVFSYETLEIYSIKGNEVKKLSAENHSINIDIGFGCSVHKHVQPKDIIINMEITHLIGGPDVEEWIADLCDNFDESLNIKDWP